MTSDTSAPAEPSEEPSVPEEPAAEIESDASQDASSSSKVEIGPLESASEERQKAASAPTDDHGEAASQAGGVPPVDDLLDDRSVSARARARKKAASAPTNDYTPEVTEALAAVESVSEADDASDVNIEIGPTTTRSEERKKTASAPTGDYSPDTAEPDVDSEDEPGGVAIELGPIDPPSEEREKTASAPTANYAEEIGKERGTPPVDEDVDDGSISARSRARKRAASAPTRDYGPEAAEALAELAATMEELMPPAEEDAGDSIAEVGPITTRSKARKQAASAPTGDYGIEAEKARTAAESEAESEDISDDEGSIGVEIGPVEPESEAHEQAASAPTGDYGPDVAAALQGDEDVDEPDEADEDQLKKARSKARRRAASAPTRDYGPEVAEALAQMVAGALPELDTSGGPAEHGIEIGPVTAQSAARKRAASAPTRDYGPEAAEAIAAAIQANTQAEPAPAADSSAAWKNPWVLGCGIVALLLIGFASGILVAVYLLTTIIGQ